MNVGNLNMIGGQVGNKLVHRIYLGSNLVWENNSQNFNWQARFNLSYSGATNDSVTGWNTLRPSSSLPSTITISNITDQDGNTLSGISMTITSSGSIAEDYTGPSTPNPELYNQRWVLNNIMRVEITGLDNSKAYELQILTSDINADFDDIWTVAYLINDELDRTYDFIQREITQLEPQTISFDDSGWMRFKGASRSNNKVVFEVGYNGGPSIIQAFILTEKEKINNGVQTFHTSGNTDSPLPYVCYEPNGTGLKPAVIFFHGSGERGSGTQGGLEYMLNGGANSPNRQVIDGTFKYDMYAFSPQIPTSTWWDEQGQNVSDFIDYIVANYNIDSNRVYLIGFSDGVSAIAAGLTVTQGTKVAAAVSMAYDPILWYDRNDEPWYSETVDPSQVVKVPHWVFRNEWWNSSDGQTYLDTKDGVDHMNSLNPGCVKMTSFRDEMHTDPSKVLNATAMGSLITDGFAPYDQDVYDWLLEHSSSEPVGRTFIIGDSEGLSTLDINATDVNAPWAGNLLDGDKIQIIGGYYDYIEVANFDINGTVTIENADLTLVESHELVTTGYNKNVILDFTNKQEYGLKLHGDTYSYPCLILDDTGETHENITIRGIWTLNVWDYGWQWGGGLIPYNNGAGQIALKNLLIENCKWTYDSNYEDLLGTIINIFGRLDSDTGQDTGYSEDVTVRNIVIEFDEGVNISESSTMFFRNVQNLLISGVYIKNVNIAGYAHERIINIYGGQGIVENIRADNCYGNIVRIMPLNRVGKNNTSIIRNIIKFNPLKYSTIEVNDSPELEDYLVEGTEKSNVKILGNSYIRKDDNPNPDYTSTVLDVFGDGDTVTAKNNLAVRPYDTSSAINGPVDLSSNNRVYASTSAAGITDFETLVPDSNSDVKGKGVEDSDLVYDYYGTERLNPPSVGAVEAI